MKMLVMHTIDSNIDFFEINRKFDFNILIKSTVQSSFSLKFPQSQNEIFTFLVFNNRFAF